FGERVVLVCRSELPRLFARRIFDAVFHDAEMLDRDELIRPDLLDAGDHASLLPGLRIRSDEEDPGTLIPAAFEPSAFVESARPFPIRVLTEHRVPDLLLRRVDADRMMLRRHAFIISRHGLRHANLPVGHVASGTGR